jgi:hypothetical protein
MERLPGPNIDPSDRDTNRLHLDAARAALRSLDELAAPDGVTLSGKVVAQYLGVAMNELSEIDGQTSPNSLTPPEPQRVACQFCGKMIMPTATLCGFCWRRPGGPATA